MVHRGKRSKVSREKRRYKQVPTHWDRLKKEEIALEDGTRGMEVKYRDHNMNEYYVTLDEPVSRAEVLTDMYGRGSLQK